MAGRAGSSGPGRPRHRTGCRRDDATRWADARRTGEPHATTRTIPPGATRCDGRILQQTRATGCDTVVATRYYPIRAPVSSITNRGIVGCTGSEDRRRTTPCSGLPRSHGSSWISPMKKGGTPRKVQITHSSATAPLATAPATKAHPRPRRPARKRRRANTPNATASVRHSNAISRSTIRWDGLMQLQKSPLKRSPAAAVYPFPDHEPVGPPHASRESFRRPFRVWLFQVPESFIRVPCPLRVASRTAFTEIHRH